MDSSCFYSSYCRHAYEQRTFFFKFSAKKNTNLFSHPEYCIDNRGEGRSAESLSWASCSLRQRVKFRHLTYYILQQPLWSDWGTGLVTETTKLFLRKSGKIYYYNILLKDGCKLIANNGCLLSSMFCHVLPCVQISFETFSKPFFLIILHFTKYCETVVIVHNVPRLTSTITVFCLFAIYMLIKWKHLDYIHMHMLLNSMIPFIPALRESINMEVADYMLFYS